VFYKPPAGCRPRLRGRCAISIQAAGNSQRGVGKRPCFTNHPLAVARGCEDAVQFQSKPQAKASGVLENDRVSRTTRWLSPAAARTLCNFNPSRGRKPAGCWKTTVFHEPPAGCRPRLSTQESRFGRFLCFCRTLIRQMQRRPQIRLAMLLRRGFDLHFAHRVHLRHQDLLLADQL
jgi:hypothetical protein